MDDLKALFTAAMSIMQLEIEIYGFAFTWWDVFLWSAIATVVGILIVRFLQK